jgi:hypothetical protein
LYAEFVRDGLIVPVNGRVVNVTQGANKNFSLEVTAQGPWASTDEVSSCNTCMYLF